MTRKKREKRKNDVKKKSVIISKKKKSNALLLSISLAVARLIVVVVLVIFFVKDDGDAISRDDALASSRLSRRQAGDCSFSENDVDIEVVVVDVNDRSQITSSAGNRRAGLSKGRRRRRRRRRGRRSRATSRSDRDHHGPNVLGEIDGAAPESGGARGLFFCLFSLSFFFLNSFVVASRKKNGETD